MATCTFGRLTLLILIIGAARMKPTTNLVLSSSTSFTASDMLNAQNVESISIRNCSIESQGIINDIDKFVELRALKLRDITGSFTGLAEKLKNLKNLKKLWIYGHASNNFPAEIYQLASLERLIVCYSGYNTIPEGIEALTNLEDLRVLNDKPVRILGDISKLQHLKRLSVTINSAERPLLDGIFNLSTLEELEIIGPNSENEFDIPAGLDNLRQLKKLVLKVNAIISFPKDMGNQRTLEELYIYNSNNISLPDNMDTLVALRRLILRNNKYLSDITERIGLLVDLEELDISSCSIETLPLSISRMTKLKRLFLGDNPNIESLPATYRKLEELSLLYLIGCPIQNTCKNNRLGAKELKDIFGDRVILDELSSTENDGRMRDAESADEGADNSNQKIWWIKLALLMISIGTVVTVFLYKLIREKTNK